MGVMIDNLKFEGGCELVVERGLVGVSGVGYWVRIVLDRGRFVFYVRKFGSERESMVYVRDYRFLIEFRIRLIV